MANNTKTKAELEQENENLSASLTAMQEQMAVLMQQMQNLSNSKSKDEPVTFNHKIKVISLIDYPLYLTTEEYGGGKKFEFPRYGYEHNIKFDDLENIVHLTRKFAEDGFYYICDERAVEELGLDEAYKNILSKEKIAEIVELYNGTAVSLFQGASHDMQENIVEMIANKINKENKVYDLNLLDQINKIYGKNVQDVASKMKK